MSKKSPTPEDIEKLMREIGLGDQDVAEMHDYLKRYEPKPSVDEQKANTLERIQAFVDTVIKPRYVLPEAQNDRFPYPVNITVEWRKNTLYFTKHLLDPQPVTGPDASRLVLDYARMSRVGQDRYNAAYKRHTGKYQILYYDLSLEECLEVFAKDMLLLP